jgi:hypothetical protein
MNQNLAIFLSLAVAGVFNVRSWFAYAPWILVTAANIVLDVVASIHFASDASESRVSQSTENAK